MDRQLLAQLLEDAHKMVNNSKELETISNSLYLEAESTNRQLESMRQVNSTLFPIPTRIVWIVVCHLLLAYQLLNSCYCCDSKWHFNSHVFSLLDSIEVSSKWGLTEIVCYSNHIHNTFPNYYMGEVCCLPSSKNVIALGRDLEKNSSRLSKHIKSVIAVNGKYWLGHWSLYLGQRFVQYW